MLTHLIMKLNKEKFMEKFVLTIDENLIIFVKDIKTQILSKSSE